MNRKFLSLLIHQMLGWQAISTRGMALLDVCSGLWTLTCRCRLCRDASRVWRFSEGLEAGMVGVNTGVISTASAPFGGVKLSGYGREGSQHGLEEYTYIKYVMQGI